MTTIRLKRGDDRTVRTPVFAAPDGTEPYPWAGSRAWFTAKRDTAGADEGAIIRLDSDNAGEIDLSTDGIALSKIPGTATRQLPNLETRLVFDLQVRNAAGEISTVDSGEIIVEAEVTLGPDDGPTRDVVDRLLASPAELELFLDDTLDRARAEFFLTLAGGEIRAATANDFTFVGHDSLLLDGKGSPVLLLPHAPVSAVYEVIEAPGRLEEYELAGPDTLRPAYEWNEDGVLRRLDGKVFARRFRHYAIVDDHGFATIPDEVRGVAVRCAARAFENPEGTRQESLGRYSYTMAGEQAGIGLYAPDLRDLAPYMLGTGARRPAASLSTGSGS